MGIRVIKTALAALAALYTAHYLNLQPSLSAGLLAILGVEVTRLKGLKSAFVRFMASVLGLFFASLLFMLLGFHVWTISIFILLVFPVLSRFRLKDGIVTSAVIVFHVYASEEVTTAIIGNEIMLLLTGLGWATVINLLYMPKEEKRLLELRRMTEEKFSVIFHYMAQTLRSSLTRMERGRVTGSGQCHRGWNQASGIERRESHLGARWRLLEVLADVLRYEASAV